MASYCDRIAASGMSCMRSQRRYFWRRRLRYARRANPKQHQHCRNVCPSLPSALPVTLLTADVQTFAPTLASRSAFSLVVIFLACCTGFRRANGRRVRHTFVNESMAHDPLSCLVLLRAFVCVHPSKVSDRHLFVSKSFAQKRKNDLSKANPMATVAQGIMEVRRVERLRTIPSPACVSCLKSNRLSAACHRPSAPARASGRRVGRPSSRRNGWRRRRTSSERASA